MSNNKLEKSQKGQVGRQAFTIEMSNQMAEFYLFQSWLDRKDSDELEFRSITIRPSSTNEEEFLVILRFFVEGRAAVAFSSGASFTEALLTAMRRLKANTIKWKEDQYG